MDRPRLIKLRVVGPGRPVAEVEFGPTLTLITGHSDTGKSHILECIDYALGAGRAPQPIPEMSGYDEVHLELERAGKRYVISRRFADTTGDVLFFEGALDGWDQQAGRPLKAKADPNKPRETLSGVLVELAGFDPTWQVVKNERGGTQVLSFRAVAPFVLIDEEESITQQSPVVPANYTEQTAARSLFHLFLTGQGPDADQLKALNDAAQMREKAAQELVVLDKLIERLRLEINEQQLVRGDLQQAIDEIDAELSEVSELAASSGARVRGLMARRNKALSEANYARSRYQEAREIRERFGLLGTHYESDLARLEFAVEAGHFFAQLAPTHCPVCEQPLPERGEECHPDSGRFQQIRDAATAELRKLRPRLDDLEQAVKDAEQDSTRAAEEWRRQTDLAKDFDAEIRQVENPTAHSARNRVKTLTTRRAKLSKDLLRFEQLDQFNRLRTEAEAAKKAPLAKYRPEHQAAALSKLSEQVGQLLDAWKFPFYTDVTYSLDIDDLIVGGQPRAGHGAGVRAVTHAAFSVGLMRYCLDEDRPHPGFVVIDTPLNNFKGVTDSEPDPELTRDVHTASLYNLATTTDAGQTVVIENIDAPDAIVGIAKVHVFSGPGGEGRQGFYPG
ncbi:MAG: AAA family ATPase [Solirubrobacteraceae bacterium]